MQETIRVIIARDPRRVRYERAEHIAARIPAIVGEALHVPNTWAATDVPSINKLFQVEVEDLPVRRRGKENALEITVIADFHSARKRDLDERVGKIKKEIAPIVSVWGEKETFSFSVQILLVVASAKKRSRTRKKK